MNKTKQLKNQQVIAALFSIIVEEFHNFETLDNKAGGIESFRIWEEMEALENNGKIEEDLLSFQKKFPEDEKIKMILSFYYSFKNKKDLAHKWFFKWLAEKTVEKIHCFVFALITGLEPVCNTSQFNIDDIETYEKMFEKLYVNKNVKLNGSCYEDCLSPSHSDFYIIGRLYELKQEYCKAVETYEKGMKYAPDYRGQDFYPSLLNLYYDKLHDFENAYIYSEKLTLFYLDESSCSDYYEIDTAIWIKVYSLLLMFHKFDLLDNLTEKLIINKEKIKDSLDFPYLVNAYLNFKQGNKKASRKNLNLFLSKYHNLYWYNQDERTVNEIKKSKLAGENLDNFMSLAGCFPTDFLHYTLSIIIPKIKYLYFWYCKNKIFASVAHKLTTCIQGANFEFIATDKELNILKSIFPNKEILYIKNNQIIIKNYLRNDIYQLQILLNKEYISYLLNEGIDCIENDQFYLRLDRLTDKEKSELHYKQRVVKNLKFLKYEIQEHLTLNLQAKYERELKASELAERDRIMANMAHSIKNLISSVQTPLQLVSEDRDIDILKKHRVEHALKGLSLIKEIAFAIDHSYTGAIDDFRFDAQCKTNEGHSIQSLIQRALMHSAGNMFDRDYFEKPSFNYFPKTEKEKKDKALKQYQDIADSCNSDKLKEWLNNYFFKFSCELDLVAQNRLKDTKSSAMKFFILMQEILMNAVKYASFVTRDKRFLSIKAEEKGKDILISIKNSFVPRSKEKTTGKGMIVIEKFAEILGHKPEIIRNVNAETYEIKIKFENFWQNSKIKYEVEGQEEFLKVSDKTNRYET
jgi:hypothetical protein